MGEYEEESRTIKFEKIRRLGGRIGGSSLG